VSVAVVIGAGMLGDNLQRWYQALADWAGDQATTAEGL
jgi:hypothetical protein